MSTVDIVAKAFIETFDLQQSIDGAVDAIDKYYSNPTPETLGEVFGFIGTQAIGQLIGNSLGMV